MAVTSQEMIEDLNETRRINEQIERVSLDMFGADTDEGHSDNQRQAIKEAKKYMYDVLKNSTETEDGDAAVTLGAFYDGYCLARGITY